MRIMYVTHCQQSTVECKQLGEIGGKQIEKSIRCSIRVEHPYICLYEICFDCSIKLVI